MSKPKKTSQKGPTGKLRVARLKKKKFEYKLIGNYCAHEIEKVTGELNVVGEEGWQLVAFVPKGWHLASALLMREKQ